MSRCRINETRWKLCECRTFTDIVRSWEGVWRATVAKIIVPMPLHANATTTTTTTTANANASANANHVMPIFFHSNPKATRAPGPIPVRHTYSIPVEKVLSIHVILNNNPSENTTVASNNVMRAFGNTKPRKRTVRNVKVSPLSQKYTEEICIFNQLFPLLYSVFMYNFT